MKVYDIEQAKCSQRAIRLGSVTGTTPGNFRRQRGSTKVMRSLAELTDDKQIFPFLHLWFTWILRAGGNKVSETLLEGLPTEDTVIHLEKQGDEIKKEDISCQNFNNIPDQNGFIYDNRDTFFITDIRHLFQFLGEEHFRILTYHSIIGNQLIFISDKTVLISSIINALKSLLPGGCFSPIFYANEYQDSWKCNFIGIPSEVTLPSHVLDSNLHIRIEIMFDENASENAKQDPKAYSVGVSKIHKIPNKLPQVLLKMIKGIQDVNISNRVLEHFFISLKEEWMNKVKVLFKFSRSGSRSQDEADKILTVLGALNQDRQFLKFWMTGLSTQYKTHVLSSAVQSPNVC
ncbi:Folliculin [Nymphon striatum]|nr:Folliculin [Nymphon striatum]